MASIDEVLMAMSEEDYLHDDIQFILDENLRTIAVPANGVVLGVVGDKNTNRVNFKMNRYYNGFDMSEFTTRINYINADLQPNYYTVTDLTIEDDLILFTWLVDSDAVAYKGNVSFVVHMFRTDGGSTKIQIFNSTIASARVLEGIEVEHYVTPEEQEDLIMRIYNDVVDMLPSGGGSGTGGSAIAIASPTRLGGVKPVAKTSAMTQDVGVDSTGKLYTAPSGSSTTVAVNPTQTSGTKIAEITVNGVRTAIYAPAGGSGGASSNLIAIAGTDAVTSETKLELDPNGTTIELVTKEELDGLKEDLKENTDRITALEQGGVINPNPSIPSSSGITVLYWHESIIHASDSDETGKWIDNNGNVSNLSGANLTDYIPVIGGKKYYYLIQNAENFAVYNEAKQKIASVKAYVSPFSGEVEYTMPSDAKYIRATYKTERIWQLSERPIYKTTKSEYQTYEDVIPHLDEKDAMNIGNPILLSKRKWLACGDSITQGIGATTPYCKLISERNGMILNNVGVSGTGFVAKNPNNKVLFDQINGIKDGVYDLITILCGINDCNGSITIGTADSTDESSVCGAMNKVLAYCVENFRNTCVIGIVPLHSNLDTSVSVYLDAIRMMYERYGIPYIDGFKTGRTARVNSAWASVNMADQIHPNDNGHVILARAIEKQLHQFMWDVPSLYFEASYNGVTPSDPDEPEQPATPTLTGITVTWSADNADVGTDPKTLITSVKANMSDGTSQTVTGYTVTPTALVEGANTVTVTYQGKNVTKSITGNAVVVPPVVDSAKYPLPTKAMTLDVSGKVSSVNITDGDHISAVCNYITNNHFFLSDDSTVGSASALFANAKPVLETIPTGAEVTIAMRNITIDDNFISAGNPNGTAIYVGLATSATDEGRLGAYAKIDKDWNGNDVVNTFTANADLRVKAFSLAFAYVNVGIKFAFDVEITVSGTRWV